MKYYMKLYQLHPETKMIYETVYLEEMNSYIQKHITSTHKASWIEEHLREKQRHFILVVDDDNKISRSYIVLNIESLLKHT